MIVRDIIKDLKSGDVFGTCDDSYVFARLTDAVSLIANQGIVDPLIGEMDIGVCDGCVALPPEVEVPLAVNIDGHPTLVRDEWFQYHINGAGSNKWCDWNYTDYLGRTSVFKNPSSPVRLVVEVESIKDSQAEIRVFGWDNDGKRIYSDDGSGTLTDGILVPAIYGFSVPHPTAPLIARIDRVQKSPTNGFVKLIAVEQDGTPHTTIGYYRPDETNPDYARIRVPGRTWIRVKYKKKNFEIRSQNDWINIRNREVVILAAKAVHLRRKGAFDAARAAESEAVRILSNEADSLRPKGISPPQIIFDDFPKSDCDDRLFY